MSRTPLLIIGVVIVGVAAFGLLSNHSSPTLTPTPVPQAAPPIEKSTDFQAGFAIFTNGTFRVFIDSKYHNLSEDVFIQADNPNIVHVKKSGVTWDDFFKTLPMSLNQTCLTTGTKQTFCTSDRESLKFYLNGKRVDNLLSKQINPGDRALISFGSESDEQIMKQLEKIPTFKQ